jgi:hypothetical protein
MCSIRCFLRRASVSLPPTKHGIDSSAQRTARPAPREHHAARARTARLLSACTSGLAAAGTYSLAESSDVMREIQRLLLPMVFQWYPMRSVYGVSRSQCCRGHAALCGAAVRTAAEAAQHHLDELDHLLVLLPHAQEALRRPHKCGRQ